MSQSSSASLAPGRINGIDLCPTIQRNVDFRKVKEAGFEFVYIKSSQYSKTTIGAFDKYVDQARNAGLRVGAYHFCSHDTDPEDQAEFFFRASKGLGQLPGDLPPMADWEFCTASVYVPPKYPLGHPAHCVNWAERFMKHATELWYPDGAGRKWGEPSVRLPVLYTYPNYSVGHQPALRGSVLGIYPLCLASYKGVKDPSAETGYRLVPWLPAEDAHPFSPIPNPWDKWTLWQYSGNNGLGVPGVTGDCDRQVASLTNDEWMTFLGLAPMVHSERPLGYAAIDEVKKV